MNNVPPLLLGIFALLVGYAVWLVVDAFRCHHQHRREVYYWGQLAIRCDDCDRIVE